MVEEQDRVRQMEAKLSQMSA